MSLLSQMFCKTPSVVNDFIYLSVNCCVDNDRHINDGIKVLFIYFMLERLHDVKRHRKHHEATSPLPKANLLTIVIPNFIAKLFLASNLRNRRERVSAHIWKTLVDQFNDIIAADDSYLDAAETSADVSDESQRTKCSHHQFHHLHYYHHRNKSSHSDLKRSRDINNYDEQARELGSKFFRMMLHTGDEKRVDISRDLLPLFVSLDPHSSLRNLGVSTSMELEARDTMNMTPPHSLESTTTTSKAPSPNMRPVQAANEQNDEMVAKAIFCYFQQLSNGNYLLEESLRNWVERSHRDRRRLEASLEGSCPLDSHPAK